MFLNILKHGVHNGKPENEKEKLEFHYSCFLPGANFQAEVQGGVAHI